MSRAPAGRARTPPGLHVVGLGAGIGSIARAAVAAGVKLGRLAHCDIDGVATQTAAELLARLRVEAPRVIGKSVVRGTFSELPADIRDITYDVVESYCLTRGAPDLIESDLRRLGAVDTSTDQLARVIGWFRLFNPNLMFIAVAGCNADSQLVHARTSALLGVAALHFDSALVSPSSAPVTVWTNVPDAVAPPERCAELEDILEPGRRPNVVGRSDGAYNAAGFLRRKAPALAASGELARAAADALIFDMRIDMLVPATIEEEEQMVGLQPGDTASSAATPRDRHRLVRRTADVNAAAHFLAAAAAAATLSKVQLGAKIAKIDRTAIVAKGPRVPTAGESADSASTAADSPRLVSAGMSAVGVARARPTSRAILHAAALVGADMLQRQPWLEHHYTATSAADAERPSDIKFYLAQRRDIYINVPVQKNKFVNRMDALFERVKLLRRRIKGERRTIMQFQRLDGSPTALHWVVPPAANAAAWKHELHQSLHQPTQLDDENDVYAPGARLDVSALRAFGIDPDLCDEVERGERYQLERQPLPFARGNYGS